MKTIAVKCDSIQVEQYRMESKLCPEPTASLQGKEIYIGPSGQWKIKGKDLIAIHINAEQIIIETEKKLTFVLKQFQGATVAQANQWNSFGTNVNSLYQKYRSDPTQTFSKFLETSSRHNLGTGNFAKRSVLDVARKTDASRRGVFGSKGHANQTAKTLPMPWDDVGTTNVRQDDAQDIGIRHAKLISGGRKLKQLSKGELSSSDEEATVAQPVTGEKGHLIETRMDHHGSDMDNKDYHLEMVEKEQLLGTNKENEVGNERKRRRKLISKLKGRPKVLSDDDDTDDENIFDSKLDLTTPVAQRLVTPAGTNVSAASLKRENDDDNSDSETSVAIAIEKNQPRISNFFHARRPAAVCSFDPQKNIASASPVKTPPRFNLSANSARMVRAASAAKAKMKQLDQVSGTLWLRTSPARGQLSSAEKRKHELFGTVKRDCRAAVVQQNEDSGDPIEEYSVTPRRIALKRAVIGDRVLTSGENLSRLDLTSELASFGGSLKTQNKFRGLQNLGNTCYVNAALQMLYTCRDLISRLQRSNGGSLTKSVCWVAHQLEKANVPAMSPRIVKDAMDEKTDKFAGYEQRDAHEFLSDLLDFVHEELENVSRNDQATADEVSSGRKEKIYFPTDDFCLTAKVCLKCCTCGYSRDKEEMYRHLSIDIVSDEIATFEGSATPAISMATVEKSLNRFFRPEVREIKCEKCEDGTHAQQTLRIVSRPKLLLLHLKRFIVVERPVSPVAQGDENQTPNSPAKPVQVEYIFKKNKAPVFIPPSLSLKAFVATQLTDKEASASSNALTMTSESYSEFHNDYLLKSIVHHIGSRASSGHYTADAVRHGEGAESQDKDATSETAKSTEDEWVSFDDGNVVRTTLKTITEGRFKQETAYMLLYTLNDDDTNSAEKFSSSLEKGNH